MMPIRVLTAPGCDRCHALIEHYRQTGQNYLEINTVDMIHEIDRDAINVALAMNDMALPLVQYPGMEWQGYTPAEKKG